MKDLLLALKITMLSLQIASAIVHFIREWKRKTS